MALISLLTLLMISNQPFTVFSTAHTHINHRNFKTKFMYLKNRVNLFFIKTNITISIFKILHFFHWTHVNMLSKLCNYFGRSIFHLHLSTCSALTEERVWIQPSIHVFLRSTFIYEILYYLVNMLFYTLYVF